MDTQQITIDIPRSVADRITTVQIEQEFKRFIPPVGSNTPPLCGGPNW